LQDQLPEDRSATKFERGSARGERRPRAGLPFSQEPVTPCRRAEEPTGRLWHLASQCGCASQQIQVANVRFEVRGISKFKDLHWQTITYRAIE